MDSAHEYLAKATKANADREQQRRIDYNKQEKAAGNKVPDLNPADRAVAKMQQHAASMKIYADELKNDHVQSLNDYDGRIARLENLLQLTLDSLNAASIECSGGSVVLTLPDLPT